MHICTVGIECRHHFHEKINEGHTKKKQEKWRKTLFCGKYVTVLVIQTDHISTIVRGEKKKACTIIIHSCIYKTHNNMLTGVRYYSHKILYHTCIFHISTDKHVQYYFVLSVWIITVEQIYSLHINYTSTLLECGIKKLLDISTLQVNTSSLQYSMVHKIIHYYLISLILAICRMVQYVHMYKLLEYFLRFYIKYIRYRTNILYII